MICNVKDECKCKIKCKNKLRKEVEEFVIDTHPLLYAKPKYRGKYLAFEKKRNGWKLRSINDHLNYLFMVFKDYFKKDIVFVYIE